MRNIEWRARTLFAVLFFLPCTQIVQQVFATWIRKDLVYVSHHSPREVIPGKVGLTKKSFCSAASFCPRAFRFYDPNAPPVPDHWVQHHPLSLLRCSLGEKLLSHQISRRKKTTYFSSRNDQLCWACTIWRSPSWMAYGWGDFKTLALISSTQSAKIRPSDH